jgi:PAS domain S-box-containing protein
MYRTIFENSAVAITLVDENENIVAWNRYTESLLGMDGNDLHMRPVASLYPEEEWRKIRSQNVRQKGMQHHFETKIIRKDRRIVDIDLSLSVLRAPDGEIAGSVGVMADITERRRAEDELKRTMAELEHSNEELEWFAYVASHDLQEPLRAVTSYVELLAENYKGKLDADADDFIAFAVDGAAHMRLLIEDLLAYSRVRSRSEPFEPTDCAAVLGQALSNLQASIEENGAVVTHDSLPTVVADESQLVQLFQNLISNAVKFRAEEPPRVHIAASQGGNEWVFSIRDNGIGIPSEYADRIFVAFQRLHSQRAYPGTGIGMAICKKIVERHGGRIWMESDPGKGSTFYFTIPGDGGEKT